MDSKPDSSSIDQYQTKASIDSSTPDHDFHNGWGCTYRAGRANHDDDEVSRLWQEYTSDPAAVGRKYHMILGEYTRLFGEFFRGYFPISLHAHASDAMQPTTIASLILNTVATSPLVLNSRSLAPRADEKPEETGRRVRRFALDFLGWDETHVRAPNFVLVDGCYGAGYGPLAHASKEWEINAIAAGPRPVIIDLKSPTISEESLDTELAAAKASGCIAVVVDLVSTEDGAVLSPERFAMLKAICPRHGLLLIADETMTAIRCGAPFAFQREEYALQPRPQDDEDQKVQGEDRDIVDTQLPDPDLVIFGKGLGVSGVALNFSERGALARRLAYAGAAAAVDQTIRYWRALVSRPVALPTLIEALSTLRSAKAEDWPARSIRIGDAIRDVVRELEPRTREPGAIGGLAAVIAVDRSVTARFRIMSAIRRRSPVVRWLPKLGVAYEDRGTLVRHVFGPESNERRRLLSAEADRTGAMPLWCFVCGIGAVLPDWCRECFLACCNNEVCVAAFRGHKHGE